MERLRLLLPARLRDSAITYLVLAALWPLMLASVSAAFFAVYDHLRPGMLSAVLYFSVTGVGALLSAAGSAVDLLTLPIRHSARIAVAVSGGILVLWAFGLFQAAAIQLCYLLNLM